MYLELKLSFAWKGNSRKTERDPNCFHQGPLNVLDFLEVALNILLKFLLKTFVHVSTQILYK